MRFLTLNELLEIYVRIMEQSGGLAGVRDLGAVESALAQPRMAFGGEELYPTVQDKAAALAFSLIRNHPFLDGTSASATQPWRRSSSSTATRSPVDDQERVVLSVADGTMSRADFTRWVSANAEATGT